MRTADGREWGIRETLDYIDQIRRPLPWGAWTIGEALAFLFTFGRRRP